jgi:hypothetical protein
MTFGTHLVFRSGIWQSVRTQWKVILSYITAKKSKPNIFNELLGTQYYSHETEGDEMNGTYITHEETQ